MRAIATLTTIRQTTAKALGRYHSGTFKSSGNSTTTGIDESLISSLSINDQFTDGWLVLPAKSLTDREARIVSSFTPSSGTLTIDRAWSTSTVPNSTAYEWHALIEPITQMTSIINDALKRIMVVTEITLTPTADATRHEITTANTWLVNPTWVRQVGYLATGETRATINPYEHRGIRGWPDTDGANVYINHPKRPGPASGETWYIRCLKPAYDHCKATAGSFGGQAGLSLETDEAPVEAEFVAWVAICVAIEQNMLDWGLAGDAQLETKRQHAVLMATWWNRQWEVQHREDTALTFKKARRGWGVPR